MDSTHKLVWNRLRSGMLVLCCLGFAVPLLVYMLIGTNMRYSGDDYCYAATLTQHGFWGAQVYAYQHIAYYNGNRFSLNLFSSLADLAGPYASAVWPALALVVWLAGLFFLFKRLLKFASVEGSSLALLLAAETVVFSTLAKTPDIDQSLFWRSGMLPYLASIIASTFLALLMVRYAAEKFNTPLAMSLAAFLALIGAGFSETSGLVQASWLVLGLFIGLVLLWYRGSSRQALTRFVWITAASLVGTLVSLLVLVLSPTVLQMKPQLAHPPGLLETLQLSMLFSRRFLSTLKTAPLENLFPAVVFAALTVLLLSRSLPVKKIRLVHLVGLLLGVAVATYLLILSSMVAFSFAQQSYPEPRAEVIPRFILTLAQAAAGCLAGIMAIRFFSGARLANPVAVLTGIALVTALAYPLWIGRVYWGELPRYQHWAEFWDRRDREIRQARRQGIVDIHAMELDHIIPRLIELSPDPKKLYNQCAAGYYGLNTLTADLPGWDD